MPLKIVRNDITKMNTEAIVNTANDHPAVGSGCDYAIYQAAGREELLAYRKKYIGFVEEGQSFITPGFHLQARYIIHAVSPRYEDGMHGEEEKLRSCYQESLRIAWENHVKSIAFPLISTGGFGYPKEEGLRIAVDEIHAFLMNHAMLVYLVVFDQRASRLGTNLYPDLESYIDQKYVEEKRKEEYDDCYSERYLRGRDEYSTRVLDEDQRRHPGKNLHQEPVMPTASQRNFAAVPPEKKKKGILPEFSWKRRERDAEPLGSAEPFRPAEPPRSTEPLRLAEPFRSAEQPRSTEPLRSAEPLGSTEPLRLAEPFRSAEPFTSADVSDSSSMEGASGDFLDFEGLHESKLEERMRHLSDTFSQYLLYLIRSKNMGNAEVYKRAIVDKKIFSKIKNNVYYHPQKLTALCLCIGAKLNLDESKDLLARAGYALSPCDKTDIIFSYFIENQIYDMIELDIQLEEHGLPCIIS